MSFFIKNDKYIKWKKILSFKRVLNALKRIYKVITNEDLLKEISEQELKELSDLNANGILNQNVIDDALNDSISFCESFIILPNNPTPLLKKIIVDFTIYELRRKNGLVQDSDKELKKENEAYLLKMSTGRLLTNMEEKEKAKDTPKNFAFKHQNKKRVDFKGFRWNYQMQIEIEY